MPLKFTTPLAFEIPFGRSTIWNDAFCSCSRPRITGFAAVPVTAAFNTTPPDEKMSALTPSSASSFTLPSTRRFNAPALATEAVPVIVRFAEDTP